MIADGILPGLDPIIRLVRGCDAGPLEVPPLFLQVLDAVCDANLQSLNGLRLNVKRIGGGNGGK